MHLPSHFINTKWGPFCGWCLWSFVGRKKHFNVRCKAFCQKITVHCISKEEKVRIPIYVNGSFEYNTGSTTEIRTFPNIDLYSVKF